LLISRLQKDAGAEKKQPSKNEKVGSSFLDPTIILVFEVSTSLSWWSLKLKRHKTVENGLNQRHNGVIHKVTYTGTRQLLPAGAAFLLRVLLHRSARC
jgi:hypothetical protein